MLYFNPFTKYSCCSLDSLHFFCLTHCLAFDFWDRRTFCNSCIQDFCDVQLRRWNNTIWKPGLSSVWLYLCFFCIFIHNFWLLKMEARSGLTVFVYLCYCICRSVFLYFCAIEALKRNGTDWAPGLSCVWPAAVRKHRCSVVKFFYLQRRHFTMELNLLYNRTELY